MARKNFNFGIYIEKYTKLWIDVFRVIFTVSPYNFKKFIQTNFFPQSDRAHSFPTHIPRFPASPLKSGILG